ncbi:phage tail tape measure protein [Virgibacillus sp. C22-A2]|uniref:Phage tail tape measure protein n=1 Tax=Virgibacillus tibetensis TaxID=3042313 RepID=A0ABU6KAN8_9BACI|nr:phage tail tape measure protein [Virgibacillus sp. C22-A2]
MQRIEGLSIGLDLETMKVESGLTDLKSKMRLVNSEMKTNMSAFDRSDRSIGKYETRLQGLNKKLEVQAKVTDQARIHYEKMVAEHGEGSKEAEKAATAYNTQATALNNLERYVEGATEELEAMRKEQAFLESGMGKLTTGLDKFSGTMKRHGETLTTVGRTLSTRVTAPILAAGAAAIAASDQFDKAYRDIRVGTGATGDVLDGLEKSFDNVFTSVPDGADQVSNSLATLNTFTGATGESLEGLTTSVLDVSRLLKEDATTNSKAFGESLKQWQKPAEEGAGVLDYLFKLTQDYGVGLGELNGLLTSHGSVLNNAGFEMEESAHFMASLESNGIAVSRIMPGLNSAFRKWADEGKNSREELEKVVDTIAETEDKQKALSLATEVFGAQGAQRLMTAIRSKAIPAFEDLGSGAESAKGLISETAEETKTIGEEFAELKNNTMAALRPVGDILLNLAKDYLPPVVEGVTDLAKWFDELDDSTKKTILSTMGIAAALGPASLLLGSTFKVVGSLAGGLSKVTGIIGRSGGSGLLGRFALMGPGAATPVGLGILGIGALALKAYDLNKNMHELQDVSTETADAMMDQYQANIPLIDSFDELRQKSFLTNDEFARYLDLQTRLGNESDPDAIATIKDEMEQLQGKSGLSNKELDKMVGYNNTLTEKIPEATTQITEQGNRVADTTGKLKDYNQEIANMAKRELESELQKSLVNEIELREQIKEEQIELNRLTETEFALRDILKAHQDGNIDTLKESLLLEQESVEEAYREAVARGEVSTELSNKKAMMETLLALADMDIDKVRETLSETITLVDEQGELVAGKEADLNKTGEIVAKMVEYELIAAGINEETAAQAVKDAEVSGLLGDQLKSLRDQKDELYAQTDPALQLNDSFIDSVGAIDKQIHGLQTAKGNIQDLIGEAGEYNEELKKDIDKRMNLDVHPSIDDINRRVAAPVRKRVDMDVHAPRVHVPIAAYARGTKAGGHPGGLAITGDGGGRELISLPNGRNFLSPSTDTLLNLPKGTHVLPHRETERLLNTVPRYATGTSGWEGLIDNLRDSEFMKLLALVAKSVGGSAGSQSTTANQQPTNVDRGTNVTQHITIHSPEPLSPSETARRMKQASRQLAMEWR